MSENDVVAESTTVVSDQPFLNPVSQQNVTSMTVGTETEQLSVIAGYGYDGQPRITTGYDAPNALATGLVRQVGSDTYDAAQGQALAYGTFDVEPISTLGPLENAQLDPNDPCATAIDVELCREGQAVRSTPVVPLPNDRPASPGESASINRVDGTHLRLVEVTAPNVGRSGLGRSTVASAAFGSSGSNRRTKDYEKRGNDWVLVHIMDEITQQGLRGSIRYVMHQNLSNIAYFRNAELDAARRRRRAAASNSLAGGAPAASPVQAARRPPLPNGGGRMDVSCDAASATLIIACDEPTSGGTGGPGDPPAPNQTILTTGDVLSGPNGGATALVLQHGFNSSGITWVRMQNWLNNQVRHGGILVPTTVWEHTYEDQATGELASRIPAQFGSGPVVLIGHSNGGMISRYLSQQQFGGGAIGIQGVITIGTPHQGTPLAGAGGTAIARLLGVGAVGSFLLCRYTDTAGCRNTLGIIMSSYGASFLKYTSAIPVLDEMQWNDSYHSSFNSVSEAFPRFGIASQMWSKWGFWREYGDAYCYEDSYCGGSAQVGKVDKIYHHDLTCAVISGLFWNLSDAGKCIADAVYLRAFDDLFQRYAQEQGSGTGDLIVPLASQLYPNVPAQNLFTITDGPAHWGETSDLRVKQRIEQILQNSLGMQLITP